MGNLGGRMSITILGFALIFAGAGCAKQQLIPSTKVVDTPENREVLTVVEKYRRAMERLDAAGVLVLVHPTYQDPSGTPEASDDLDYGSLKKLLVNQFKKTSRVRYRIEYQDVRLRGSEAEVDTYIDATFVYDEPSANPRWRRLTDHNRFRLIKDGKTWRFIAGL